MQDEAQELLNNVITRQSSASERSAKQPNFINDNLLTSLLTIDNPTQLDLFRLYLTHSNLLHLFTLLTENKKLHLRELQLASSAFKKGFTWLLANYIKSDACYLQSVSILGNEDYSLSKHDFSLLCQAMALNKRLVRVDFSKNDLSKISFARIVEEFSKLRKNIEIIFNDCKLNEKIIITINKFQSSNCRERNTSISEKEKKRWAAAIDAINKVPNNTTDKYYTEHKPTFFSKHVTRPARLEYRPKVSQQSIVASKSERIVSANNTWQASGEMAKLTHDVWKPFYSDHHLFFLSASEMPQAADKEENEQQAQFYENLSQDILKSLSL